MALISTVRVDHSKPFSLMEMNQGINLGNISGLVSLTFFIMTKTTNGYFAAHVTGNYIGLS